ncbi:hypothetical protein N9L20_07600 [Flavobacteriaceae bacterium]|nr:hypothetical protein [Flavobacteriaceae bacterium]
MSNLNHISNYISNDLDLLELGLSLNRCFVEIQNSPYQALPVSGGGLLFQDDLLAYLGENELLENNLFLIKNIQVSNKDSYSNCFKKIVEYTCPILPVYSENNIYLGYYDCLEMVSLLHDLPGFQQEIQEVIISHSKNDFSAGKISHIIEGQGDMLYSYNLINITDTHLTAFLKLKSADLSSLLQIFRSYGYHIVSTHENDDYLEDLKERSSYLDKFLNI